MPFDQHWLLAAGSLLAVILAAAALLAALARHSIRFHLRVQYSKEPARRLPVFEFLCAAPAAVLAAMLLNHFVQDEPSLVRASFAAAVPAVLIAAICWAWITTRAHAAAFDEARVHSRAKAADACRPIREALDAPTIHAAACAAISQGLGATDVRLYLRDDRVFALAYSTTGSGAGPRDYNSGAPLVEGLSRQPSLRPLPIDNDGPQLAVPFSASITIEGFFLVGGGPYPPAELGFAHEIARETARALALSGHVQKQVEIRSNAVVERREVEHTRRALQHLVPPDQPAIPGVEFAVDSWRGDKPGGQFIDVLALPSGALGVVRTGPARPVSRPRRRCRSPRLRS
jgi:hypothetical protein